MKNEKSIGQFLFDSDAQNFKYCKKKSSNFSDAPTTPTRDVEKYSPDHVHSDLHLM